MPITPAASRRRMADGDARRPYRDLAGTWPIIRPPEDNVDEAGTFRGRVSAHARRPVKTLLDLGCGGGHNDATFRKNLRVVGADVSEAMLRPARSLNPEVEYHRGEMRTIRLRRRFVRRRSSGTSR